MFSAEVLDHFEHPRNAGELPGMTTIVDVTNPACGDEMRLSVRIEAGRIAEARFKTRGCVTSIAASSALTEMICGKNRVELSGITPEQISQTLGGLPAATFHGAQLAADALAAVLAKFPR